MLVTELLNMVCHALDKLSGLELDALGHEVSCAELDSVAELAKKGGTGHEEKIARSRSLDDFFLALFLYPS
jgi:hypothetical protein